MLVKIRNKITSNTSYDYDIIIGNEKALKLFFLTSSCIYLIFKLNNLFILHLKYLYKGFFILIPSMMIYIEMSWIKKIDFCCRLQLLL